jgi:hypothetical protein
VITLFPNERLLVGRVRTSSRPAQLLARAEADLELPRDSHHKLAEGT